MSKYEILTKLVKDLGAGKKSYFQSDVVEISNAIAKPLLDAGLIVLNNPDVDVDVDDDDDVDVDDAKPKAKRGRPKSKKKPKAIKKVKYVTEDKSTVDDDANPWDKLEPAPISDNVNINTLIDTLLSSNGIDGDELDTIKAVSDKAELAKIVTYLENKED